MAAALAPAGGAAGRRGRPIAAVFTSPAQRAVRTAELAGLGGPASRAASAGPAPKQDPDLWEWDYGGYEGITTAEIQRQRPGWSCGGTGSSPATPTTRARRVEQVGERVDRVLKRAAPLLAGRRRRPGRARPRAAGAHRPLARPAAGRRAAVPAGHRHRLHPRHRARRARHPQLERPAGPSLRAVSRQVRGARQAAARGAARPVRGHRGRGHVGVARPGLVGDPGQERRRARHERRREDLRLVVAVPLGEERGERPRSGRRGA